VIEELRAAVDALNHGDAAPFVALIAEGGEWRGITRGHLWWKDAPS
jgi:ketosteroid isomerase-like protein